MKNIVSENITKYRREAGLTQEDLGHAVGVSTQAVSKWECGGMPDAALFPVIADTLNVSIDSLFGREPRESINLLRLIEEEILRSPEPKRMDKVYDFAWAMMKHVICNTKMCGSTVTDMMNSIKKTDRSVFDNDSVPAYIAMMKSDSGIMEASIAEDYQYFLVMPEPEKGYVSILKNEEEYLKLFRLLLKEGCFHILMLVYACKLTAFTVDYITRESDLPVTTVSEALEDLKKHNFLEMNEVATADGVMKVYKTKDCDDIIPFLYFTSQFMSDRGNGKILALFREKPLLTGKLGEGNCLASWRTDEKQPTMDICCK